MNCKTWVLRLFKQFKGNNIMYKRRTFDEYQLHINYGQGWEHEISEESRKEAKERIKEYCANCPQYPVKIVVKRVKIIGA
jgi:hypothetical protein